MIAYHLTNVFCKVAKFNNIYPLPNVHSDLKKKIIIWMNVTQTMRINLTEVLDPNLEKQNTPEPK